MTHLYRTNVLSIVKNVRSDVNNKVAEKVLRVTHDAQAPLSQAV
ncbi:MAG: hypothetical protein PHP57_09130 [Sideroxydans sp.]|nr:hypothetical protein [Sideroxydans sp.]